MGKTDRPMKGEIYPTDGSQSDYCEEADYMKNRKEQAARVNIKK